jgi:hypothetical protein
MMQAMDQRGAMDAASGGSARRSGGQANIRKSDRWC